MLSVCSLWRSCNLRKQDWPGNFKELEFSRSQTHTTRVGFCAGSWLGLRGTKVPSTWMLCVCVCCCLLKLLTGKSSGLFKNRCSVLTFQTLCHSQGKCMGNTSVNSIWWYFMWSTCLLWVSMSNRSTVKTILSSLHSLAMAYAIAI